MATGRLLSYISAAFCFSAVSSLLSNTGENLVIRQTEEQKPGASNFIIAHTPSSVTFLPKAGAIPSDEVSSVIGLALGFSSTKELSWAGLLAGDVFRRPKANVLITIDGVTEGDMFSIPGGTASFPITKTEGASSLAGILSTSSVTQENLPSRVSGVFGGKSLTVSASGSELLAAAGYAAGQNSHTMFWSQAEDKFKQVPSDRAESLKDWHLTKAEILKRFKKNDLGADVKFSSSGKVFTVSVPGKGNAVFDMERKEDFLLFAEVDGILQLLEKLKDGFSNLLEDGVPDVFTLSFSSLKGLRRRYSEKSLQVEGAVEFLKQVISEIVKKFTDLYNGNVLVELLTLEWYGDLSARYPQEMRVVYQEVQPHLLSQSLDMFQDHLPSVALRTDLEEAVKHSLCESVQNKLLSLQSPLRVACSGKHRDRRAAPNPVTAEGATSTDVNVAIEYDENYPVIFNIWLWLVVVLVLSLYAVCVVMWYMDPGRDSIIYRMTSQRIKTD